ncbi:sigma-E factor negative regulatory protein [Luteibacter aegosomatis]|uniref:sigma-E factor negative regulatory protein n=1 Tax=Luteibacter aegosomatis TaxID=2911537 RepID=UPI001FF8E718|nr:sigma-E factor negative regulatory protein [Luteibacter aegosomatis]UPG84229.1 sigma-E factor negative regulatory protein [Luteibacter aegosomatis]
MSEANREFLSAGMDGELSREEIRFLLRRLEADQGLSEAWSRYHLGRDGLRGQTVPPVSRDFASRVMAAIEAEVATAPAGAPRRRWLQWSAGGAIAASVAVAALMLSQPSGSGSAGAPQVASRAASPAPESVAQVADIARETAQAPVAPQWLSGGNMASQFTQKAAFEGPGDDGAVYLPRSTPYQIHRTRAAAQAPDNSPYMLLIRPDGSRYVAPVAAPQAR